MLAIALAEVLPLALAGIQCSLESASVGFNVSTIRHRSVSCGFEC